MRQIGERLAGERDRLDLSQVAMASLGGVAKRSQQNYESGERMPDAAYLAAIAGAGADVLYILTGQRDPTAPALDAAERVLLDSYRRCSAYAKANLIQTAALLSAGLAPAAPPDQVKPHAKAQHRPATKAGSGTQVTQTFHGIVQGGVAGGNIVHPVGDKGGRGK